MSIRPIDLQVVVQNSTGVSRNVANETTLTNMAQHTFEQTVQKEVRQLSEQVNQTNKSEENKVDQDGSNGNQYQARKRNNKQNVKNRDKDKRKAASTSLFDMSI